MSEASIVIITLFAALLGTGSEDWAQFRGPGSAGVAPAGSTAPVEFGPERALAWKTPLPPGHSSPCIVGDRIFLTAVEEGELLTLALDRESGRLLWRRAVKPAALEKGHEINSPAASTPACDAQHVCVYFGSFGLIGYDHEGTERWRREMPVAVNTFGSAASPVLHEGRLIFCNDQKQGSFLEMLDAATGERIWRRDREGFGSAWSTPMVWRRGEVEELIVYGIWWLNAYDLATGEPRWSVPGLADEPCITPVHGDGLLFVSSYNMRTSPEVLGLPDFALLLEELDGDGDGEISRAESEKNVSILSRADADGEGDHPLRIFFRYLDRDQGGGISEAEWGRMHEFLNSFQHKNALVALRPGGPGVEPEIVWQHHRGVPECPSPLYHQGRVHLVKNGGLLTCLDAKSGEVHYHERLESGGPYYSSPVACDGRIYVASARGVVTVLEEADTLKVLARNDLGERLMATPAFDGRRIYVRGEAHLFAFEESGP